ncbi:SDR family oxidoreductase [Pacificibacter marinus]|uniref:SDR family oxidoreductase n=1 Tax=Pacificibacter marinus TaxID=658057 RepID=UPI001C072A0C|nr:SDR family NAD(P)-dependent oxidoreductase [Pacificibacter marinus]MBU2867774.1 SDR family NAD(P)-dependent oxidoreductase [Pacificibacter marinus]
MTQTFFEGRTVLVTGGARGIGRALTSQLVTSGAHVIAVGRNQSDLSAVRAELGDQVTTYQLDLTHPHDVTKFVERVTSDHPELSVLINNAGIQTEMDLFDETYTSVAKSVCNEIDLNLLAPIALTWQLIPVLRAQPEAIVVNITTGLAISPKEASPIYCATKAGLRSFTQSLRYQCQTSAPQIQVIEAIMTLVDTDMTSGRGKRKMSSHDAAAAILKGVFAGKSEIWIGKSALLPLLSRVSPRLVRRILR